VSARSAEIGMVGKGKSRMVTPVNRALIVVRSRDAAMKSP
jgi:hypothetical protein